MRGSENLRWGTSKPPLGEVKTSVRAAATLRAGRRDPPCGHVKLGDRPRGQDGKWPRIAIFGKISKRKPGDRPQRIDFEPRAARRAFSHKGQERQPRLPEGGVCTQCTHSSPPNARNRMHPIDANETTPASKSSLLGPLTGPRLGTFCLIKRRGSCLNRRDRKPYRRRGRYPPPREICHWVQMNLCIGWIGCSALGANLSLHWVEVSSCSQCDRTLPPNGT